MGKMVSTIGREHNYVFTHTFKKILNNGEPRLKLSEEPLEGYEHFGRVVMTLQKFDDGINSMRYI